MPYPATRLRRSRRHAWSRALVAEHRLTPADLIWPLFIIEGHGAAEPVASLPGVARLSVDLAAAAAKEAQALGIPAVALFPNTPAHLRDPGDAWVESPDGVRYWGRFGAAGLLAWHPTAGVLLQHRAEWSHHGGTWGIPGGARKLDESATDAAVREASEEAGVPPEMLTVLFDSVHDLGFWSYTTVVARVDELFAPVLGDAESIELRWVAIGDVETLPLHPGFASSWPRLRAQLPTG